MQFKFGFCLLFIVTLLCDAHAATDKYRLILVSDPATTITVAWNQISGNDPVVYYDVVDHGTDHTKYANSKSVDRSQTFRGMENQFARLSGLMPNTNYYFVIHDSEGTSERFWFRTAPNDKSRLSFVAGGDSRNNRLPRQRSNILVSKLKPHAVLFGGDMTDADTAGEWRDWFDDWQLTTASDGRMFPIVPTRGNHENTTTVYNLFDTPNVNSYYAMTFGDNMVRTYTLNTEISVLGDQLTWLENDLQGNDGVRWKLAQYHKPMRPHTAFKSEGNGHYSAWAQLFYEKKVNLVVDCDSHVSKTTWPIKPSSAPGNDEGFVIDELNGTVYTGEGCWGAPLRPIDDDKSWTRNSGRFNQFKLIYIDTVKIELRTIRVDNADAVGEVQNDDPFTLPENLDIFDPPTGDVVIISNSANNPCSIAGTPCDDQDDSTLYDEENGFCFCEGLSENKLVESAFSVTSSSDDAEEDLATGQVTLTGSDLHLIYDDTDQLVGIRFDNVEIPQGAALYRAYLQFASGENGQDQEPANLVVHGELSPQSEVFTDTPNNISDRPLTLAYANWNDIQPWELQGETGLRQRTPYVTSIVQEIIDQDDWNSGNAITFIISGEGRRVAGSFDGEKPPVLQVFYQEPCPPAGTECDDGDASTVLDVEDGRCNCIGISARDTVSYYVEQSSDDAEEAESGGAMYTNSSDLELVFDSFNGQNNQTVGIRFNNIPIPDGATILDAYVQFTVDETSSNSTSLVIRGEKSENSRTFSESQFDITSRPVTDAQVQWNNIPGWASTGTRGPDQRTPDLSSIVQEIIDQPAWEIFNSMAFIITGQGRRTAESYDGSASTAPELVISFSLESSTATADIAAPGDLVIYPNPTSERFFIENGLNLSDATFRFYNSAGREVPFNISLGATPEIELKNIPSGVYFLVIDTGGGLITRKVVVVDY